MAQRWLGAVIGSVRLGMPAAGRRRQCIRHDRTRIGARSWLWRRGSARCNRRRIRHPYSL